jgi:aspartate kinase
VTGRVVVLKFGGTSLGTAARVRRAARRVEAHQRRGQRPVVVVSANGRATDRLLAKVAAVAGEGAAACRESERALATGEDLSAALLALALAARGISARSLRGCEGGLCASGAWGGGALERPQVGALLELARRGVVPVVSGFQAATAVGETITLGRGGSDTSAVALAAALGAPCHIVTDVDAVYDCDPRVDAGAQPLPELDHDALLALVEGGAQVVAPAAARLASAAGVPLYIYHHTAPFGGKGGTRVRTAPAAAVVAGAA